MLCSDFETWNTAHLLARMAGEGYGALLPPPPPELRTTGSPGAIIPTSSTAAPLNGAAFGGGGRGGEAGAGAGWLVLRKHLLQWLLAVREKTCIQASKMVA